MVAQNIGQRKLSSKQGKPEDIDMVAKKIVKARCHLSKLNMKTLIPLPWHLTMQVETKLWPKNLALNNPLSKFNKSSR